MVGVVEMKVEGGEGKNEGERCKSCGEGESRVRLKGSVRVGRRGRDVRVVVREKG